MLNVNRRRQPLTIKTAFNTTNGNINVKRNKIAQTRQFLLRKLKGNKNHVNTFIIFQQIALQQYKKESNMSDTDFKNMNDYLVSLKFL